MGKEMKANVRGGEKERAKEGDRRERNGAEGEAEVRGAEVAGRLVRTA